jgi:hypothetical protein
MPPPPQRAPLFYGVWVPREGWLKGQKPTGEKMALSFEMRVVAEETAKRIGRGAIVLFIDDSLAAIENSLLEAESEQRAIPRKGFRWLAWRLFGR